MNPEEIQRIVDNEKEWRAYMLAKIDNVEMELSTFKLRVLGLSTLFGSASGVGAGKLAQLLGFFN